jgi:hypothetical protein
MHRMGIHPRPNGTLLTSLVGELMRLPTNTARVIIFAVAVAAIVVVMLVTGSADDKASPGSAGRVPVTYPSGNDAR